MDGQPEARKDAPHWLQRGRGRPAARQEGPAGAGRKWPQLGTQPWGAEPAGPAWGHLQNSEVAAPQPTSELSEDFLQTQIVIVAAEKCFTVLGPHS